jgi:hypothetical protein
MGPAHDRQAPPEMNGGIGMNENGSVWRLSVPALAIRQVARLLPDVDGLWDLTARLCGRLDASIPGRLMHCFYCMSLWIALPLAVLTSNGWLGIVVHWLALWGAACLLEKSTAKPGPEFQRVEILEGNALCVAARREAI